MPSPDEQKNQSFRSLLFELVTCQVCGLCYEQARQQGMLVVRIRMIVPARPVVLARLVVRARPASGPDWLE